MPPARPLPDSRRSRAAKRRSPRPTRPTRPTRRRRVEFAHALLRTTATVVTCLFSAHLHRHRHLASGRVEPPCWAPGLVSSRRHRSGLPPPTRSPLHVLKHVLPRLTPALHLHPATMTTSFKRNRFVSSQTQTQRQPPTPPLSHPPCWVSAHPRPRPRLSPVNLDWGRLTRQHSRSTDPPPHTLGRWYVTDG